MVLVLDAFALASSNVEDRVVQFGSVGVTRSGSVSSLVWRRDRDEEDTRSEDVDLRQRGLADKQETGVEVWSSHGLRSLVHLVDRKRAEHARSRA